MPLLYLLRFDLNPGFTEFKDKEGKVIKPKFVNLNKWIREYSGQKEKDYISGLDELAKGVEQGEWQLSGALSQLVTIPTDFAIRHRFYHCFRKKALTDEKLNPTNQKPGEVNLLL